MMPGQRNTDGTLFIAVAGIAIMMDEGKYDAIVAERFDPLAGAVNWAKEHHSLWAEQEISKGDVSASPPRGKMQPAE